MSKNIVLMGPPGVGKGTQGIDLALALAIPIISSGDIFREIRHHRTALARRVRAYMDKGEYVPDDVVVRLVLHRIEMPAAEGGFILDGFPRTVAQAQSLDMELRALDRNLDHVILLDAPAAIVLARLAGRRTCSHCGHTFNQETHPARTPGICDVCGGELITRLDESPEVQRHRFEVYEHETRPVVDYYTRTGRLQRVDATRDIESIQDDLLSLTSARC
jgi:adenylate kinase